ncbi:MAG TPA: hypothetical protein ENK55_06305 [Actinobacteria bacterium]|nr:hypothetical protein [Actinomycetota bacterium]
MDAGSTASAVAGAFGRREGLDGKISDARGCSVVSVGSLLLGARIALSPFPVVDALSTNRVLDGLLPPFLVAVVLAFAGDRRTIGHHTPTDASTTPSGVSPSSWRPRSASR